MKCEHCRLLNTNFCESCVFGLDKVNGIDYYALQNTAASVNHPPHYNTGKYECIDAMIDCFGVDATKDFCLLNAFKYLWRCRNKGKELEDVEKAKWYLEKFIVYKWSTF